MPAPAVVSAKGNSHSKLRSAAFRRLSGRQEIPGSNRIIERGQSRALLRCLLFRGSGNELRWN